MKFLRINSLMLNVDALFTFPIFLFDSIRKQRLVALHANSPVTSELKEQWNNFESKGAHLQISIDIQNDFLFQSNVSKEELDSVNSFELDLIKTHNSRLETYSEIVQEEFLFRTELNKAIDENNFTNIISRAKAELLLIPFTISSEVSIMTNMVEKLLVNDNYLARVGSFTYFFTTVFGIKDKKTIAQIILATMIKDVGLSLINLNVLKNSHDLELSDIYLKHPMLSIYMLSKNPIELSSEVKRIILEQHEKIDGTGFPRGKKENSIAIASQIVHLCDHIFKFSEGKIDGQKKNLHSVMRMIVNKNEAKGLVTSFSQPLLDVLKVFIMKDD